MQASARLYQLLGVSLALSLAEPHDTHRRTELPGQRTLLQAELYRMRGELLLARDGLAAAGEALACFERAMKLGRKKGALAWEMRAAMSIMRLRERQGEGHAAELAEARERLRETYQRFTEGFDLPDLQDAAGLIGAGEEMPARAYL